MLDAISYIGLGVLDSLSVVLLMFKLYRWPVKEYWLEILLLAAWNAIISYVIRFEFDLQTLDIAVQLLFSVLMMRYVIKAKTIYSLLLSMSGYLAYIVLQSVVASLFIAFGAATEADTGQTYGIATVIQITSFLTGYLLSYALYHFRLGFSFVIRPPHAVRSRERRYSNRGFWISTLAAALVVSASGYLVYHVSVFLLIPLAVLSFAILYGLSKRRERQEYDRTVSLFFGKKD